MLGLVFFLIMTLYTDQAFTFPRAIMRTYKLGKIEASSVVFDKQGCNIINQYVSFNQTKSNKNNQATKVEIENDLCIFPKINVLSKLGKEAYVEADINTSSKKEKTIRFTMPSSSIISYNPIN